MGFALIFNNEIFPNLSHRIGSKNDVIRLKRVFHKFNFRVKVVLNPLLQDIRENMKQLLNEDLDTALCLVLVVMTHGKEGDMVYAKDVHYSINHEILQSEVFQKTQLSKIVITQACKRSSSDSKTYKIKETDGQMVPKNVFRFDSTFEDSFSYRMTDGSPFIQFLCEYLEMYGIDLTISNIANKVIDRFRREKLDQYPLLSIDGDFKNVRFGERVTKAFKSDPPGEKEFVIE